jgi:integrase
LVWHFIDMYLENVVKFLEPKNQPAAERACADVRACRIGDMPIRDVMPKMIAYDTGLRDKWDSQRPTAKHLHRYLQGIFGQAGANWAIDKNPTEMRYLKPFLSREKYHAKPRDAISFEHVPRFLALLRTMRSQGRYPTQALVLEMLVFSGIRPEEPLRARWKEIDPDMTVWTVPKANLKRKAIDRPLPITIPMRNVLIEMQARRVDPLDNEALIFPPERSPDGRGGEINGTVVSAVTRTMIREMGWDANLPVVPSGFRFTLSDWRDTHKKWDEALVERQQDHVPKEKTQVALRYTALVRAEAEDRTLTERRAMMEEYGKWCDPAAYTA